GRDDPPTRRAAQLRLCATPGPAADAGDHPPVGLLVRHRQRVRPARLAGQSGTGDARRAARRDAAARHQPGAHAGRDRRRPGAGGEGDRQHPADHRRCRRAEAGVRRRRCGRGAR
nr:hypothetical protein [Tanacetum cinerariifolium]